MSRVSIRETKRAKQSRGVLPVGAIISTHLKAALDRMSATIVIEMFLPLLHEILKARIAHGRLGDRGHKPTGKTDVGHAECVRQIAREPLQPEIIYDIETPKRTMPRIVAERHSIARLA